MKVKIGAIELELTVDEFETLIASGAIEELLGPSKIAKKKEDDGDSAKIGNKDLWDHLLNVPKEKKKDYDPMNPLKNGFVALYGCQVLDPEPLTLSSNSVEPVKYEEMRQKIIEQHPDWPLGSVDLALECDLETIAKCKEQILKKKSEEKPEN